MTSAKQPEHFVTLFDSHYLPLGLCLHRSLEEQGRPFHLWIVAIDNACADSLEKMRLSDATIIRLNEVESDALRSVKTGRTVGEYCWTLTAFLPSYLFRRMPHLERVTYLDADLFFFQSPELLIDEFLESGKHVLITEHAFAPEYAQNIKYGRFCVQFVTFRNTEPARRVLKWWQERCIEWCFAREEDGKFGDQKYLDRWPEMFGSEVHVLTRTDRTVAPWNVAHLRKAIGPLRPAFYHFHGLRIVSASRVLLYFPYYVGWRNRWIYERYVAALRSVTAEMRRFGIPVLGRPLLGGRLGVWRYAWATLKGRAAWSSL